MRKGEEGGEMERETGKEEGFLHSIHPSLCAQLPVVLLLLLCLGELLLCTLSA